MTPLQLLTASTILCGRELQYGPATAEFESDILAQSVDIPCVESPLTAEQHNELGRLLQENTSGEDDYGIETYFLVQEYVYSQTNGD